MDPLGDDFEIIYSPKIEPIEFETDSENEEKEVTTPPPLKKPRVIKWGHEETVRLIELYAKECPELWDAKHLLYKDRTAKVLKQTFLANHFNTTTEEINRKIHNLRTQFNGELRKLKKRRKESKEEPQSRWEYFENLSFLQQSAAGEAGGGDDAADAGDFPDHSSPGGSVNLEV